MAMSVDDVDGSAGGEPKGSSEEAVCEPEVKTGIKPGAALPDAALPGGRREEVEHT